MRYMIFASIILVTGCGGLDDGSYLPAVAARAGAASLSAPVQQAPAPMPIATNNPSPYNNPAPPQTQPQQPALPPQAMQQAPQTLPATSAAPLVSNSPLVSTTPTTSSTFAQPKQTFLGKVADTLSSWYQRAKRKITGDS